MLQLCKYLHGEYLKVTHWNQIYWDEKKQKQKHNSGFDELLHVVVNMRLQTC